MKIVHISWMGPKVPGGIETMLPEELALTPSKHDCTVIFLNECCSAYAQLFPPRVKVYACNRKPGSGVVGALAPVLKLNFMLFFIRPDLVVVHTPELLKFILYRGAKVVCRVHNTGYDKRFFVKACDRWVAISNAVKKDICVSSGCSDDDVSIVYNGINTSQFERKGDVVLSRGRPFTIVQVSRLDIQQKAQDLALRSLSRCISKYEFFNWQYDIIGAGPSEQILRELVEELGLSDHVNFLGNVSQVFLQQNLKDYDLFMLPSHYEGLGNVVLEAMAAGVPVLCSDVDGPSELVGGNERGYLFEAGNEDACAQSVYKIFCSYGQDAMQEKVGRAYQYVQQEHDIGVMVKGLLRVYEKVVVG